jgi:error-prone DNA polymerase
MNNTPSSPGYAELHCISNFTFLHGAFHPEELVRRTHELGYRALAVTDECSLADGMRLVLLAMDREGYGGLSQLITLGRRRAEKGEYFLERIDLEKGLETGLERCLALLLSDEASGLEQGVWLAEQFPGRAWIGVELHRRGGDRERLARLRLLGEESGLPLVACGGVLMHSRECRPL